MKKMWRKARRAAAVLLSALLVLSLSGCWSRRELNTLGIVLGTALDTGSQPDTLTLTAQVVRAGQMRSGSMTGGAATQKAYVNIQGTDKSVLSVLRGLTHMLSRRLYFAHNQVLIFSSDLAKTDIAEGLDAFTRDYETRMNVYILVSRGKASEVLDGECELEEIPAIHISRMMENQKASSEVAIVTVRDFCIAMLSGSTAPVAPMIEMTDEGGKKKMKLEGTAVFKQGKMIGELDRAQTRGLLWVTDKSNAGVMTVNTDWGQVILETMHSKSSLRPVKAEDGRIRMELTITEDGFIESNETYEDMSLPENVDMLKGRMKEAILSDVNNALAQAKSLSADVFGFGDLIRSQYPKEWEELKGDWDRGFSEIELDTTVEVKLRSTGGLVKPVVPGGAQ